MFDNLFLMMGPAGIAFALIGVLVSFVGAHAVARRLPNAH